MPSMADPQFRAHADLRLRAQRRGRARHRRQPADRHDARRAVRADRRRARRLRSCATRRCISAARCRSTAASCCTGRSATGNRRSPISDDIGLTTSKDMLEAVGRGEGPRDVLVSLGYAGWSAGQLEQEIAQNAWLTVAADGRAVRHARRGAAARGDGAARHRLLAAVRRRRARLTLERHDRAKPGDRGPRTVLAFDFGTRIGVAVGNTVVRIAHPLTTDRGRGQRACASRRSTRWSTNGARRARGRAAAARATAREHEMTARAERFARQLEGRFGLPVARVDERYTTRAAAIALREAGVRGRARDAALDAVAAQLILQAWFDEPSVRMTPAAHAVMLPDAEADARRARRAHARRDRARRPLRRHLLRRRLARRAARADDPRRPSARLHRHLVLPRRLRTERA